MLRYNRLPHVLFYDTLIAGIFSKRGNKSSQMYGAYFVRDQALLVAKKGDTHETLFLLFNVIDFLAKGSWTGPKNISWVILIRN